MKTDQALIALCLWREAREEGLQGMRAVGHVIRNRVLDWHKTWEEIILAPNQFTSMSVPKDPEYKLLPHEGDKSYAIALALANDISLGGDPDTTSGCTFYCNPATATSGWFARAIKEGKLIFVIQIGRHNFYKEVTTEKRH